MNTSQTFLTNQGEKLNFTESNNGNLLDEEVHDLFLSILQPSRKKTVAELKKVGKTVQANLFLWCRRRFRLLTSTN